MDFPALLTKVGVDDLIVDWVRAQGRKPPSAVWEACPRGDWLLDICARFPLGSHLSVSGAVTCARNAIQYAGEAHKTVEHCVETVEMWLYGKTDARSVNEAVSAVRQASKGLSEVAKMAADCAILVAHIAFTAEARPGIVATMCAAAEALTGGTDFASLAYVRALDQTARLVRWRIDWEDVNVALEDAVRSAEAEPAAEECAQ